MSSALLLAQPRIRVRNVVDRHNLAAQGLVPNLLIVAPVKPLLLKHNRHAAVLGLETARERLLDLFLGPEQRNSGDRQGTSRAAKGLRQTRRPKPSCAI